MGRGHGARIGALGEVSGLVTRKALCAAGVSHAAVSRHLTKGTIVEMLPGVYRLGSAPDTWELRVRAVDAWAPEGSALCMETAAAWLGVPGFAREGVIQVSLPVSRSVPTSAAFDVELVLERKLGRFDVKLKDGVRCTRVERTLLDLGRRLPPERVERAMDDALRLGLTGKRVLAACRKRLARRGRPGAAVFGDILDRRGDTLVRTDSISETEFLKLFKDQGLPLPRERYWVLTCEGWRRLDFAYPEQLLGIEIDSFEFHGTWRQRCEDDDRANEFVRLGWSILRFRPEHRQTPEHVAQLIRDALECRQSRIRDVRPAA